VLAARTRQSALLGATARGRSASSASRRGLWVSWWRPSRCCASAP